MDSTCRNLKIDLHTDLLLRTLKLLNTHVIPFIHFATEFFLYADEESLVIDTESKRYEEMISPLPKIFNIPKSRAISSPEKAKTGHHGDKATGS